MPKDWRYSPHDQAQVRHLSSTLNISPLLSQVLVARGYSQPSSAQAFLNPKLTDLHDPQDLPGAADAAERIVSALRAGRRITVYGDYDVDGVTATSLLWHCLKLENAQVDYYIPSRLEEGYGLNCDAIRQLHCEDPNRLLVSVDCGISSVEEAALARELGLELVITDHHSFGSELPDAEVLVHPNLPGTDYPFRELCGVGVAFKVAWAICKRLGDGEKSSPRMREFLLNAVGLTAVGTIADVVPLTGENRILVRYGLVRLVERAGLGFQALLKSAGLNGNGQLSAENIAFGISPRINAAGRLGQARLAVELLTTEDPEKANALASYLERLNKDRKTIERSILKQAREQVAGHPEWNEMSALVLSHADWHPGVIGIVAAKVAEQFEKPAVLISLDAASQVGQGSARSFARFDLHSGLAACTELLLSHGGHAAAAGLRITASRIDEFRELFCQHVNQNHKVTPRDLEIRVDAEVRLADLTMDSVIELEQLGPFGKANDGPVFVASDVELAGPPKTMGETNNHLSLQVKQFGKSLRAVAFGRGEWAEEIAKSTGPISICFSANINEWKGRRSVQLSLLDWRAE